MERQPIVLSKNHIALILIYHKTDDLLDVSLGALDRFIEEQTANDAAKQFIAQLQGVWTPRFLTALRQEIDAELERCQQRRERDK